MRALVVTNMWPSAADPARGRFVADQVAALRAIDGVEVEVFHFPHGALNYPRAARALRRAHRGEPFDIVHAHFGLTAWPALALRGAPHAVTLHGTDLRHPRSRRITHAALHRLDLIAVVSAALARLLPPVDDGDARHFAVLPCGVDLERFAARDRAQARSTLGLDPDTRYVLFPADPARAVKRVDRARAVVDGEAELLTLGSVAPDDMPTWINAADAVIVPSEDEGFGLAVLEALACDVPVLATAVGIHPVALDGVAGTLCAHYDEHVWRAALATSLASTNGRVAGRARAELFGAPLMARRVVAAWRETLDPLVDSAPASGEGAVSL
jgi:teichuronic acid biosynthesis glycosyltransferase TuaC